MPIIAVIDDRVTNRNILARLAASVEEGLQVRAFAGPKLALQWLAKTTPDLVITDYKMPEMDGAAFIREFRSMPGAADVPVVVVTVYEDRSFCYLALEAGATDFLLSPVDHVEFRARARNLLTLRRQQKLLEHRAEELHRELLATSQQHEAERAANERRLRQLIDSVPATISAVDSSGRLTLVNAAHRKVFGIEPRTATGATVSATLGETYATRHYVHDAKVFETGEALPSFEQEVIGSDGSERILLTTKSPLINEGGWVESVVTVAIDITDLKEAEATVRHQAGHDDLTGLANRALFQDYVAHGIARARRDDQLLSVLLLDIDRFKGINDAFGRRRGDQFLDAVGRRLAAQLDDSQALARLGGDEFAVLQTDVSGPEDPRMLASRLMEAFSEPFLIDREELHGSASIGIAMYPADGRSADPLLKSAEHAMYVAKAKGRQMACFSAPHMDRAARRTGLLERELRQAFVSDQFTVHYQPQRNLRTGRISGLEALLRWRHPSRGMVRPSEFIALAEEIGLIVPLTGRVLERACRQLVIWQRAGHRDLRLSVNLSPVQFRDPGIVPLVEGILEETGLAPSSLELELTEGVMLENNEATMASLRRLNERGISISLDDFGTGYSSLAYVKRFPVQRLKVDQSFVHRLGVDGQDEAIVRAIIHLGHSLGLKITAEGVETKAQLERLMDLGCDEAQGDLISPPLPADACWVVFDRPALPDAVNG